MSDDLTRRIKRIIYPPPFRDGDETIRAIAALIAKERARAFEEVVGAFNSVGHLMSRGEIIAAIRALAKKETAGRQPDNLGHVTRIVDAATHDERCDRCGATDARGDDRLTQPCPMAKKETPDGH